MHAELCGAVHGFTSGGAEAYGARSIWRTLKRKSWGLVSYWDGSRKKKKTGFAEATAGEHSSSHSGWVGIWINYTILLFFRR